MQSTVLTPFVRLYRGALDQSACRAIVAKLETDSRRAPTHIDEGGYSVGESSLELMISTLEDWKSLDQAVFAAINTSFIAYCEECPSMRYATEHAQLRDIGYRVLTYRPNGEDQFDWHVDNSGRKEPSGHYTRPRLLAAVVYLNTVDVGGETEFSIQQLKVKPEEGAVLWFPPTFEYPHRGCTPVSGPKHVISTFMGYEA